MELTRTDLKRFGISLEKLRNIEPSLAGLKDEELEEIRAEYYDLAQLMFEVWFGSKYPSSLFPEDNNGSNVEVWKGRTRQE